MRKSILLVDDEPSILRSLKRVFSEGDYEIHLADSGLMALDILKSNEIDLVISDMRMPVMNGHELLRRIKQDYPKTMRIVLSGFTGEKEIYKSLLDGSAKFYLLKPWDGEAIFALVGRVFNQRQTLRNTNLLDALNQIENLPSLSDSYNRICQLIEQDADLDVIASAVEADQAIAASVLRLANAVFYGQNSGSVRRCLSYIGLLNLKQLVLATRLFDSVNTPLLRRYMKLLWGHSIRVNQLTHSYFEAATGKKIPELYTMAGLLCDVGKVILMTNFAQKYDAIIRSDLKGEAFYDAEKAICGVNHHELGAYLLEWWGMPQPIVETALYHHIPLHENVINRDIVCAVHLADYFAWSTEAERNRYSVLDSRALEGLTLTTTACQQLARELKDK